MNDQQIDSKPESDDLAFWFPTAYMILSVLIVIVVALTWFIPARQYDRALTEEVGHEIAVPGTFRTVDPNPQGFVNVMLAPMAGFYDPDSYAANAIDAALFVLLLGGFLGVVNATKAIDTGIQTAMGWMRGSDFSRYGCCQRPLAVHFECMCCLAFGERYRVQRRVSSGRQFHGPADESLRLCRAYGARRRKHVDDATL